jgi:hypothetical protein
MVAVDQDGGRAGGLAPFGVDGGALAPLPDFGGGEPGITQFPGQPVGRPGEVVSALGDTGDGRDADLTGELVKEQGRVGVQIAPGAVVRAWVGQVACRGRDR